MVYQRSLFGWIIHQKNEETQKEWFDTHGITDPEKFVMTLKTMENNEEREAYLKEH